ncbi:MAG TPA: hypothetical protein VHP35_09145 [Terriglobia bacterium]|nr:hypothetical protein [Terriglobia bacterium]
MSLSKLKALLVISTVFLLGAVVGASLGTSIVSKKFASPTEGAAKSGKEKLIDKFKVRLNLSPGQTETLQLILDDTHKQFKELHQTVKPQFEGIRNRMRDQIREQLDAKQKQEFEVMVREYDECKSRGKKK